MEQSGAIDWAGIRANAVTMGIRAAARAAAVNLPDIERERFVFRVLKRASREGWESAKAVAVSKVVAINEKPMSSKVLNGADSLAATLAEHSDRTRLGFARVTSKVAEHAATLTPDDLLEKDTAQALRHHAGIASTVHGWEAKTDAGAKVMINIGILNE